MENENDSKSVGNKNSEATEQVQNGWKHWCDKKWFVVVLLVLFFPLGVFALVKNRTIRHKWVTGIVCLVVVTSLAFIPEEEESICSEAELAEARELLATIKASSEATNALETEAMVKEPVEVPKPVQRTVSTTPSYSKIASAKKDMTQIRAKKFHASCIGKEVQWRGYVCNVKKKIFGGYALQIEMDDVIELGQLSFGDKDDGYDISQDIDEETAQNLQKGDKIIFNGVIGDITSMLGACIVDLYDFELIEVKR